MSPNAETLARLSLALPTAAKSCVTADGFDFNAASSFAGSSASVPSVLNATPACDSVVNAPAGNALPRIERSCVWIRRTVPSPVNTDACFCVASNFVRLPSVATTWLYAPTKLPTSVTTLPVFAETVSVAGTPTFVFNRSSVTPWIASVTVFVGLLIVMPSITSVASCAATFSLRFLPLPIAAAGS